MNSKGLRSGWHLMFLVVLTCVGSLIAQPLVNPDTESKIDALLGKMTLEEKIGQLNQYSSTFDVTGPAPERGSSRERYEQIRNGLVGSMLNVVGFEATRRAQELALGSRLGIPLVFALDVIHGYKTMTPTPLAEAASWDLEAVEASARLAAREAAAAGLHWTFAPMVDISRDARWGRIMEGAGEDPYLGSVMAVARVKGFQGSDLSAIDTIAACAKHYAAYGFAEAGRDYNTVDISEHTLRNVVLPPFKAAVDAGVVTLMNAFNEIGGVPATVSSHLQREILKGDWGFNGFVVSDWGSIGELIPHGVAEDLSDAAHQAIIAGSDMDMEAGAYVAHLADLVRSGHVNQHLVDDAVRRVLRVKFALGLFDDPYRYSNADREKQEVLSEKNLAISRDVARKSIVLLKNEKGLLPLNKDSGTIALIGPLAADKDAPLGSWRAQAVTDSAVSLLEGMQAAVGSGAKVLHAEGAKLITGPRSFVTPSVYNTDDRSGFPEAIEIAKQADVVVMALGEDAWQSGEGRSQVEIGLKGLQLELLKEVCAVNSNVVVLLMTGRPLVIDWLAENVPAIAVVWHLGSQAGHAISDVLFGDYNPSGKLPVGFPHHVGQQPLYYSHKNTGRPNQQPIVFWSHYTDAPNDALYPFGHGLSYTKFEYSDVKLSSATLGMDGEVEVSVTLTNAGDRTGSEVVQLYVRDLVGSVTRPVKELKGFQKIELAAGATKEVTFTLSAEDLAFYTRDGEWKAEPGKFKVFIGTSSTEVKEADFALE
ncbi:MAG: beta-glucosidase BglX [Acidobacteriota bacterium]|nr:MAG: beta-glucosidase BglX [Acidobacteriota bacterium]